MNTDAQLAKNTCTHDQTKRIYELVNFPGANRRDFTGSEIMGLLPDFTLTKSGPSYIAEATTAKGVHKGTSNVAAVALADLYIDILEKHIK